MTFANQTSAGIDDNFATVCKLVLIDRLASFALCTQSKRLIGDQFVGREAIVQLTNLNIIWSDTSLPEGFLSAGLRHVRANKLHRAFLES